MTPHRGLCGLQWACAFGLLLASVGGAAAQFLPGPGQSTPPAQFPSTSQTSPFPPPPAQRSAAQDPAFPPPPGQRPAAQDPAFPPPPGRRPAAQDPAFPPPPAQRRANQAPAFPPANQRSTCEAFIPLREAAEKEAAAIRAAGERKLPREQICGLFKRFAVTEAKVVKFLVDHQSVCGIPPQAINASKAGHAKTLQIRTAVCSAAAAPPGPTLSDALGGPIIADDTSKKTGGTFDTLTGNALAR